MGGCKGTRAGGCKGGEREQGQEGASARGKGTRVGGGARPVGCKGRRVQGWEGERAQGWEGARDLPDMTKGYPTSWEGPGGTPLTRWYSLNRVTPPLPLGQDEGLIRYATSSTPRTVIALGLSCLNV